MTTVEQVEMMMYRVRPDLWAISRVLKHCKGTQIARTCWDSMNDTDKTTLTQVSNGCLPEALGG